MQKIEIVYPGCEKVLNFSDLLEALEHVVGKGQQRSFMIKPSEGEAWTDGAEMYKGLQKMFEPVDSRNQILNARHR